MTKEDISGHLLPQDLKEYGENRHHQEGKSGIPQVEGQEKDDRGYDSSRNQHPDEPDDEQYDRDSDDNQGEKPQKGYDVHSGHPNTSRHLP